MKKAKRRYVICVRSDGAEDLEVRKVYRVLPDRSAAARGHIRVVDESGEAYLYPVDWFVVVDIPEEADRVLAATSGAPVAKARTGG